VRECERSHRDPAECLLYNREHVRQARHVFEPWDIVADDSIQFCLGLLDNLRLGKTCEQKRVNEARGHRCSISTLGPWSIKSGGFYLTRLQRRFLQAVLSTELVSTVIPDTRADLHMQHLRHPGHISLGNPTPGP
jgi:hypothetical protein